MTRFRINPYISFIESRLVSDAPQQAVFHRLTNEIIEPGEGLRTLLQAAKAGTWVTLSESDLDKLGDGGNELKQLIHQEFLISENHDPLTQFSNHYVARPIQNPAVAYRSTDGDWILVRTSMEQTIYSRKRDDLPLVIEEKMSPLTSEIFLLADGTKTLQQIFTAVRTNQTESFLQDSEFRTAIDWLTTQERQLIKLTLRVEDLDQPFQSINIVPRNLYHSDRWDGKRPDESEQEIIDFHLTGIEDAGWEFDLIEPTINHCFRFPHDALGGLDYGSSFCNSTLRPEVVPLLDHSRTLEVLEIGGGTGSFAKSFIEQARTSVSSNSNTTHINYHILDLSPALMESQRKVLSHLLPESRHFQQDATQFDIPGRLFDLIIANEVIADFPVVSVRRKTGNEHDTTNGPASRFGQNWQGEGVYYLDKYELFDRNAPDSFFVNAGALRFIERAWKHLRPGGTLILSEYGWEHRYPTRSVHLNHDEFSIHFGHVAACAAKVGFKGRLTTLKEFLSFNDELLVLNGREEHILCLNHVLKNYGTTTLPFAVISESQFERQTAGIAEKIGLTGHSFAPVKNKYHFGPNIEEFLVLILNKSS